jgi:hypothetical protein
MTVTTTRLVSVRSPRRRTRDAEEVQDERRRGDSEQWVEGVRTVVGGADQVFESGFAD